MSKISEKLLHIQNELKVPKNMFNSYGGYKYRNCESILETVKPLCLRHNVVLTVRDEITLIGERYYVKAIATLTDVETGESTNGIAYAREDETRKGMDVSQITGSCSSYARKYALNGLFCLDDEKDADSMDNLEEEKKTPNLATKQQLEVISKLGIDISKMLDYFHISKIDELTQEQAKAVISQKEKNNAK